MQTAQIHILPNGVAAVMVSFQAENGERNCWLVENRFDAGFDIGLKGIEYHERLLVCLINSCAVFSCKKSCDNGVN